MKYDAVKAEQMLALLRTGVSVRTAYTAVGFTQHQFRMLMTATEPHLHAFRTRVQEAVALAVARAEQLVYKEKPELWLLKGPGGRATPGESGWTERQSIEIVPEPESIVINLDLLDVQQLESLEATLRRAYPSLTAGGPSSGAGEEIAGEVLSVRRSDVPVSPAQPEADRSAGTSGTGGDPPASGVDAPQALKVGNEHD